MTVTRPRPDAYREPAPSRTPPTPPTRARATANGAGRTPGTAVGSARRPAPTTRPAAAAGAAAARTAPASRPAPSSRTAASPRPASTARQAAARAKAGGSAGAAATLAAAQPVPQTQPRPEPARRTPLRIVGRPDQEAKARLRRRLVAGALVGLAFAGLFAIVGVRVLLAQGQMPVDRLESQLTAAEAENQRLLLDVARLESPTRIVAEARTRLAMAPPPAVVYLQPLPHDPAAAAQSPAATPAG